MYTSISSLTKRMELIRKCFFFFKFLLIANGFPTGPGWNSCRNLLPNKNFHGTPQSSISPYEISLISSNYDQSTREVTGKEPIIMLNTKHTNILVNFTQTILIYLAIDIFVFSVIIRKKSHINNNFGFKGFIISGLDSNNNPVGKFIDGIDNHVMCDFNVRKF